MLVNCASGEIKKNLHLEFYLTLNLVYLRAAPSLPACLMFRQYTHQYGEASEEVVDKDNATDQVGDLQ